MVQVKDRPKSCFLASSDARRSELAGTGNVPHGVSIRKVDAELISWRRQRTRRLLLSQHAGPQA